jgi:membrane-bound lytic murein transglycosylase A
MRRLAALCLAFAGLALGRGAVADDRGPAPFRAEPVSFTALDGWAEDDHHAAFASFRGSCPGVVDGSTAVRGRVPDAALVTACRAALETPVSSPTEARLFFETRFEPVEIVPETGAGFLTGYFEPEYRGSLVRTEEFATPLLAPPVGMDDGPYPDRAGIEAGALGDKARPLVFLADPVEAFLVHVQGSARIRLGDGRVLRLAYAGRNGQPYTAIAQVLAQRQNIPPGQMDMPSLVAWLRTHAAEAPEVMRLNRSYIFFRVAAELAPAEGPVGGAGIPLSAGRSLAIDPRYWSYGQPVWLDGKLPSPDGETRLARLAIAQDTGSAIVGPARGDLFFGTGPEAGARAGLVRHRARFVLLLTRSVQNTAPLVR